MSISEELARLKDERRQAAEVEYQRLLTAAAGAKKPNAADVLRLGELAGELGIPIGRIDGDIGRLRKIPDLQKAITAYPNSCFAERQNLTERIAAIYQKARTDEQGLRQKIAELDGRDHARTAAENALDSLRKDFPHVKL